MKALLSIKPIYASKIFCGEKRFEFRRKVFKKNDVDTVLVYGTSPISKIIGEFVVVEILSEDLETLWEITKDHAGISKDEYFRYFSGIEKGHAIRIGHVKEYLNPISLKKRYGMRPPQSFVYLD